jgi:hypothetical protein
MAMGLGAGGVSVVVGRTCLPVQTDLAFRAARLQPGDSVGARLNNTHSRVPTGLCPTAPTPRPFPRESRESATSAHREASLVDKRVKCGERQKNPLVRNRQKCGK